MQLPKDLISGTYRAPKVILCQTNKDKICQLDVTELQGTFKFNGYSEISFKVASVYTDLITGEQKRAPYYDYIEGLRLVYLEGFGYFQLQDPEVYSDGIQEYKSINAYSLEYSLSQRYLENFIINMGDAGDTIGSIDGVVLYNKSDVDHSLLHLVLQKAYGWTIGHVDDELASQGRSFEIDRESIYDFIMNDMCETFKCYVEFDTINNTVNVYSENEIERFVGDGETKVFKLSNELSDSSTVTINGHETKQYQYNVDLKELVLAISPAQGDIIEVTDEFKSKYDTDVLVAFENLSNEMHINYSADDIKTVLTVKGADDLNIRNVNFGLPSIMNLDYYCTSEWMGDKLYNEYLAYVDKQDKYMSGFYSEDVNGATEESFDVVSTKQDFTAGSTREFIVKGTQESFNANGDISYFNIDKASVMFDLNSATEEHEIDGDIDTFTEPEIRIENIQCVDPQIETITAQEVVASFTFDGDVYVFELPDGFNFNENSIVKINGSVTNNYTYTAESNTVTIDEILSNGDAIAVVTCENTFTITSAITSMSKLTLNDVELQTGDYQYADNTLVINSLLNIGDIIKIFTYQNVFTLTYPISDNSTVYLNNDVINNYSYDIRTKKLTVNVQTSSKDSIKISTPLGEIVTSFQLSSASNQVVSVKVDGVETTKYLVNQKTLTITDNSILKYGSTVTVESVKNHFTLNNLRDKIICVKINNVATNKYSISGTEITITSNDIHIGDTILIESIDTHFDLSSHKDKTIVSVTINGTKISSTNYQFDSDAGILTIKNYNLNQGDNIVVKLVRDKFLVTQAKGQILSVKIDLIKTNYSFNSSTNVLTISTLEQLFNGTQVIIESVDEYFTLNQTKGVISSVSVDGNTIDDNEFIYNNNKLIISSERLKAQSNIMVEFVDNNFYISLSSSERIVAVKIGDNDVTYSYDEKNILLTIDDKRLKSGAIVKLITVNNQFMLFEVQDNTAIIVTINEVETNNYVVYNTGALYINDELHVGDKISVESIDNHFILTNDVGARYIVLINDEQIPNGKNGYEYDTSTNILTINSTLYNGDKVKVRSNLDSANALLIVDSNNAGKGEIFIDDVKPTLQSYQPQVGHYVVKIDGYTEILQQLYQLIDNRLNEENSVPDEYKITEIKLNPDNFEEANKFLPDADIEHLGEVYKIINQDKVEENGVVTYNDIAYKYYVCEMKMVTFTDEEGKEHREYKYLWNERDLVFGGDGINSLKEKIDIYSSINDVQIAAEWDQKPQDSDEYKSYVDNLIKLQNTKKELEEKQQEVGNIEESIQEMYKKIQLISEDIDVNKNFAPDSLDRLSLFLREDEYSDDCFCITDIDTDLDIINTQKELLVAGYKKLKTISRPTLSFSASMKNIYAMPEFEPILRQFELGNLIKVRIRPDYIKKARLLEVQINFDDLSSLSCTFGDLLSVKSQGDLHADLLAQAVSAGKSVASGSSYWQKGYDIATAIDERIRQGLIDATTSIRSNSAGQDVSWDNYGIHLRKIVDGVLDNHEGWITNNKFLYSDDNFKTTKSVFGNYVIDNETYWGILAGCVSAGLIEGSKIIGGEICIGEREDGTYNFRVAPDGTVTMNKGDAAAKLSYFSFDGDNGLIIGENKDGDYFSRVSAQRIEFCRKARILTVYSEPQNKRDNYDYILYEHQDDNIMYYDYYKNPDFIYKTENPKYEVRYTSEDPIDIEAEIKFGIPITYFANDTAYMKQAEIEGSLKVGTKERTPSISLGNFRLQIESNGSLSIIAT